MKYKFPDKALVGVDFGCGPGRHMLAMQQHQIHAYGIDLSNVVVADANALLFVKMDTQKTQLLAVCLKCNLQMTSLTWEFVTGFLTT